MMRSTFLIAWREAAERARSRAYQVSTIVTLLLVGGAIALASFTSSRASSYDIGVVGDVSPSLRSGLLGAAANLDAKVDIVDLGSEEAATQAVDDGTVDAAVVGTDHIIVKKTGNSEAETIAEAALRQSIILDRLQELGVDPSVLTGDITVTSTQPADSNQGEIIAIAAVLLLFIVITTYGQWVLLGALEEKATGVVEQIVSAVSVRALLAGKVIGIGLLGLAQLVLLVVLGLVAGAGFNLFDIPSASIPVAFWSLLWFIVGFAIYAALYAAAGSLVSRTEDAQAAAMPVALTSVAAYLVTFTVIVQSPDSTTSTVLSMIPLIAPIAFPARIAFASVPVWEMVVGVAIAIPSLVLIVRLAARIYAGALLGGGGRVRLRQAWRAAAELSGPTTR